MVSTRASNRKPRPEEGSTQPKATRQAARAKPQQPKETIAEEEPTFQELIDELGFQPKEKPKGFNALLKYAQISEVATHCSLTTLEQPVCSIALRELGLMNVQGGCRQVRATATTGGRNIIDAV